jgi:glucosyl-3-phosphoglycerate synthase
MEYTQQLITTIHDFGCDVKLLEEKLTELTKEYPTAVLIPALYEEIERPGLTIIRKHLQTCHFLQTVIVCVFAQNKTEYNRVVDFFKPLPQKTYILWENGDRVTEVLKKLKKKELNLLKYKGKGRAVWLGLGLATLEAKAIALHDADIVTYDRSYPIKLLFPLVEKEFGIAFNKAYYARISTSPRQFKGRVVRLFVTPLLSALTELFGNQNYLRYLTSFHYPLSGEFALKSDLALNIRIPSNWGLEVGLLSEVYRNVAAKRISQIDLGFFDHKHQEVGNSRNEGLQKMCRDIFRSILRTLTETERVTITREHIHALRIKYSLEAEDYISKYYVDATCNNVSYDIHQEEVTTEIFAKIIMEAGELFYSNPSGALIPDWTRTLAIMPDLREQLRDAAIRDASES